MNRRSAQSRTDAAAIFDAAIRAVDPADLVHRYLVREPSVRLPALVIGAGKAAANMAAGCEAALGSSNLHGEVIVADGCSRALSSIRVVTARHPLPDSRGERAAHRIVELLRAHDHGDILCLISGGASSLLVYPQPPVTLEDKITSTRLLLQCGADIHAVNCVRKHLSAVKGGGLLRYVRTRMLALLISDVIGDDASVIGSGPTAADPTTFREAWSILHKFGLIDRVPASVAGLLQAGIAGSVAETIKPGSVEAERGRSVVIGSNHTAIVAAAAAARARGWSVHVITDPLCGDTTDAARRFALQLRELSAAAHGTERLCVLAGGETTVTVVGSGRGGRNQEFALALAEPLAGTEITVLSAGTDGVDGPTDVAGAFVDGTTAKRARGCGLDPDAALAANDSYQFFAALDDQFRCGPTGTNVMDIKIALMQPPASAS